LGFAPGAAPLGTRTEVRRRPPPGASRFESGYNVFVDRGVTAASPKSKPDSNPVARFGGLAIGVVLIALKLEAAGALLHDGRVYLLVVFGIFAVVGLVHGKPIRCAVSAGVVTAVAIDPSSVWVGVGIGVVAVAALVALAYAAGLVLRALDR
jgi:hypothetical protein